MAFNLFKRKEGGTNLGNFFRAVSKPLVNTLLPGAGQFVGNGALLLKKGQSKEQNNEQNKQAAVAAAAAFNSSNFMNDLVTKIKEYWYVVAGAAVAFYFMSRNNKPNYKRK